MICDVNNSLSSHADNPKNYFVVFGEANTFGINGSFGAPEEKLRACIMMLINDICLLMEKKYLNLKLAIKMPKSVSSCKHVVMDLVLPNLEKSLNGNVYDFSVNCNSFDKSNILHIHKYLMTKNNIK